MAVAETLVSRQLTLPDLRQAANQLAGSQGRPGDRLGGRRLHLVPSVAVAITGAPFAARKTPVIKKSWKVQLPNFGFS